ncbi:MAG: hypothetical protein ACRDYZ_01425 [Acidimicrobiales bacterium]
MLVTSMPLVAVELVAASVWVSSLACLTVVTASARRVLDPQSQVALFRVVGRRYGILGSASLLVAIGAGLALSWPSSSWSSTVEAAVALAGVLVIASGAGMAQARAMTRRRRQAADARENRGLARLVRRGRLLAAVLRGLMALVILAVVVLAAQSLTH